MEEEIKELDKEYEFKNYKEKQKHYKNKLKQERFIWVSTEPGYNKKNGIFKGRTYYKPIERKEMSK